MKYHTMFLLLVLSFLSVPCMAQYITDADEQWRTLQQLKEGKKITVAVVLAGEIQGKFLRVEEDNLFIEHREERIRLKRENIKWIAEDEKRRWSSPLIGATIGFVTGALIGNYMVSGLSEGYDTFGDHVMVTLLGGGMTAGCGFMVGSMFPSPSGPKVIYDPNGPIRK